ncbi:hypothetical protein Bbelb_281160 [Branchiostoma belcheri]|nr:hypothetical protein Bbelb_281160 [Branchiostoma belcheri]
MLRGERNPPHLTGRLCRPQHWNDPGSDRELAASTYALFNVGDLGRPGMPPSIRNPDRTARAGLTATFNRPPSLAKFQSNCTATSRRRTQVWNSPPYNKTTHGTYLKISVHNPRLFPSRCDFVPAKARL